MTMDNNLIERMKEDATKREPMVPRTVRLPAGLDGDLQSFADEMGFDFSVVARAIIRLGWDEFQKR